MLLLCRYHRYGLSCHGIISSIKLLEQETSLCKDKDHLGMMLVRYSTCSLDTEPSEM
jgi:hypothetical protein